jgi:LysM repeat protein
VPPRNRATVGTLLGAGAALALAVPEASASVPHTIMPGETLTSIATADGLPVDALASFNGVSPDSYVYAGETIQIPAPGETSSSSTSSTATTMSSAGGHTVVAGETLSGIAAANGVSIDSLASANGISPDSLVYIGQTLSIPAGGTTSTSSSSSAGSHTVTSGETLTGIAAANGITVDALASANGISPDSYVIIGDTLSIPAATAATAASSSGVALSSIYCPCGTVYLRSDAASAWDSMRQSSLNTYGTDLYPEGPLGAYRTYDQQAQLYQDYLNGTGAPADPPGTSSHNAGTAVDLATPDMRSIVDSIGPTFGWTKIHGPDEWWHVDYAGGG